MRFYGQRSTKEIDGILTCAYRGNRDLKCAIGCLIPDELYDVSFESFSVIKLKNTKPDFWKALNIDADIRLLDCLQRTHDGFLPAFWKRELQWIAKEFNLIFHEDLYTKEEINE